jgi:hypothetical protein
LAGLVARKLLFQPIEEKHLVCAFMFGFDRTTRLQFE